MAFNNDHEYIYLFLRPMYYQIYSGELRIDESLKEPMYDLSIKAVKLKKRVQMYQVIQL